MGVEGETEPDWSVQVRSLRALRADRLIGRSAGALSDRRLATEAGISPQTVGDWLRGSRFPQQVDPLLRIVRAMRQVALDAGVHDTEVAELLDEERWRRLYRAEAERRAQGKRQESWAAAAVGQLAGSGPGELIADVDPLMLEIHPAVEAPPGSPRDLPVLPAYVERGHDRALAAAVKRVTAGSSEMVTLVGGSSTGKTRACWEAVRTLPPGWRLWNPLTPSPARAALADVTAVGPRTAVWLNEAQIHLLTAEDTGELLATALRALLRDRQRRPVLVLGTMWPEYWATATRLPQPGEEDPHRQARLLLTGTEIRVPSTFTDLDLLRLKEQSISEPRLAFAAEYAEQGQIIQYLAGAPALIERYESAPDVERALIDAAMDARRLGHGPAMPVAMLKAGVEGYLTDQQWNALPGDWFERALAHVTAPARGAIGPLTRIRSRVGAPQPAAPLCRLADYLDQHGRTTRQYGCVPGSLWSAMTEMAPPSTREALAQAAEERGLLRIAMHFYATAGTPSALCGAAAMLTKAGRPDEAAACYAQVAGSADSVALSRAAGRLVDACHADEALTWAERAVADGDSGVLYEVATSLGRRGQPDLALPWFEAAVAAGDPDALRSGAQMLELEGRSEEALAWFERASRAGDGEARREAAALLWREGHEQEALARFEAAARSGDRDALGAAAGMLEASRPDEALVWYARAAAEGDPDALRRAAAMLRYARRTEEALAWFERAAIGGDVDALHEAAEMLEDRGRWEQALVCYERAAAGRVGALRDAAAMLVKAGRPHEALAWYERAGAAGVPAAWRHGAELLLGEGREQEALAWFERAVVGGDPKPLRHEAIAMWSRKRTDEALAWFERAAETGIGGAARGIAETFWRVRRVDEALVWFERAAAGGDPDALRNAAEMLTANGREEEALAWYGRAVAVSHDHYALVPLVLRLVLRRRTEEALGWLVRCAGSFYFIDALGEAVKMFEHVGQSGRAAALKRFGWEPDGSQARPWSYEVFG